MKYNELYPSNYLRGEDMHEDLTLTIKSLMVEDFDGKQKPVLYFREMPKGLVLNKTNAKTIASLYGQEIADWLGKRIVLYATKVDFRGEPTQAIRVRKQSPDEQDETQMSLPS